LALTSSRTERLAVATGVHLYRSQRHGRAEGRGVRRR